jgi:glycosyltransferase involved in cell wall biosynthesis
VTSARGGMSEAIEHGVTGFGFPEGDADALAAALIPLLTDDVLSAAMSSAGRDRACKLFDLNKCTALLESFYDQSVVACAAKPAATTFRPQPQAR